MTFAFVGHKIFLSLQSSCLKLHRPMRGVTLERVLLPCEWEIILVDSTGFLGFALLVCLFLSGLWFMYVMAAILASTSRSEGIFLFSRAVRLRSIWDGLALERLERVFFFVGWC